MTQDDKELLFRDLCMRLPYGVIVDYENCYGGSWDEIIQVDTTNKTVVTLYNGTIHQVENVKPYLYSMNSLTDEEQNELDYLRFRHTDEEWLEFVLSKHLDWRGLIEKGLAIAVTEENNPYK